MKSAHRHMGLLMILIIVLAVLTGCQAAPQDTQAPPENGALKTGAFKGMLAPDFTLEDMTGKAWTLSELKGNSVALVFFTSW